MTDSSIDLLKVFNKSEPEETKNERVIAIYKDRDTGLYSCSQIPYDSEYDAYEDRSDKLPIIGLFPLSE